jgi:protoheme IX farnesyltransferase
VFGSCLHLLGILILGFYTNLLTLLIALLGFSVYVFVYSFLKYRTSYGTLIGSVAGGVPPVVGYCAVSNQLDAGALIVFMVIALWQMPHFFAIALYRLDDYTAASIPVLPIIKGIYATKVQMLLYIIAFMVAAGMLTFFGYTGYAYLAVIALLSLGWIVLCIKGFKSENYRLWGRKMFLFSLVVVTMLCAALSVDSIF